MKNYKKIIAFLCVTTLVLGSTACGTEKKAENDKTIQNSPSEDKQQKETEDNPEDNNEEKEIEDTSIEGILKNTPEHIKKTFDDNYSVDAEVHVPTVQKADILYAKYQRLDESTLLSIFYDGKTPEQEVTPYMEIDAFDELVSYKDEASELLIGNSYTHYRTDAYKYTQFPTEGFQTKDEIFSTKPIFGEVYTQENLSFMSKEEAVKNCREMMKKFSVELVEEPEVYAIDYQTMQKEQDSRIERENEYQLQFEESQRYNPTDGYQIRETFTEEDEFYLINAAVLQNQIPITQKMYAIHGGERYVNGSTVQVRLSSKGVIEFDGRYIYGVTGTAEEVTEILSAEQALEKAYEIYNSIITTDKAVVESIDFEYIPVPYNENLKEAKLTPVWNLRVVYDGGEYEDGSKIRITTIVSIHAVTGEEIK